MFDKYLNELVAVRREFHQIPELGYKEYKTKAKIIEYLKSIGVSDIKEISDTGVVATIYGNGEKTVGLRADIDALPVTEQTDLPFKSLHDGVMHACGHDGHIAINLICAKFFMENKDLLKGNLKLIFQPAEEGGGGAKVMLKHDILKNPDVSYMLSCHLWPSIETGKVDASFGTTFASDTHIEIEIMGKGGHGAHPENVKDVIYGGSLVVAGLKELTKEFNDKGIKNVLSICSFDCVSANNVYKDSAHLKGTLRTLKEADAEIVSKAIKDKVNDILSSQGLTGICDLDLSYIPLVNDTKVTSVMREVISDTLGCENLCEIGSVMTAEDFAFFAKEVPSCHLKIGTKSKDSPYSLHQSKYTINEDSLLIALKVLTNGIIKLTGE